MFMRYLWISIYLIIIAVASEVEGASCCIGAFGPMNDCGEAPTITGAAGCVEQTVMCPTWVTEMQTIECTSYRHEQRTRTCTTYRTVTETKPAVKTKKVMVPFKRAKIVRSVIRKPIYSYETRTYTKMVPCVSMQPSTRMVSQPYVACEMKTVCEDKGHWERRLKVINCGPCKTMTVCCRVWVPCLVTKQVPVRVCRTRQVEVPCMVPVTTYQPKTCCKTVRIMNYHEEHRTRTKYFTDYRIDTREEPCTITTCHQVPEQHTETYTVCVPYTITKQVPVRVCRMVPTVVSVPTPTCCCD